MNTTKIPPYIRSNHIDLAKWQSAVASTVHKRIKNLITSASFSDVNRQTFVDHMTLGTNLHVARHKNQEAKLNLSDIQEYLPAEGNKGNIHPVLQSYLSEYFYESARAVKAGKLDAISNPPLEFPDSDFAYTEWATAAAEWTLYANPHSSPYVDWAATGNDINTFGVITIPENSNILILGDFGTGLPDATNMLTSILYNQKPDFIIHLGDIYYAGMASECTAYTQMFTEAFANSGVTVPVFSIPGNHDYYSGGSPFFSQVMTMNANNGFSQYEQMASYFSLRTASGNWQLLAMDTGLNSIHVNNFSDLVNNYAPWLWFSEAQWHQNKLTGFTGKNILLSHHQLYSASAVINDGVDVEYLSGTNASSLTYQNGNLMNVFAPYFNNVAAWFWGHEHILGIFEDGQNGLAKGRLVGNSGYEEYQGENPYTVNGSPYQYSDVNSPVEADTSTVSWNGNNYNFYDHAYALVQLNGSAATVNYYEYPVMAPDAAILPASQLQAPIQINFSETL